MKNPSEAPDVQIPDAATGWARICMADVADVVGGGTPKTKDPANFAPAGAGIPWLTPADLAGFRETYIERGRRDLSEKGLRQSSARLMPPGTVLMSSRAPIGYLAISQGKIATNQGFKSFVLRDGVKAEFVFHWLKFIAPNLQQLGRGSTFAEISGSRAMEIPLLLAPANEQERIAKRLSELSAKLDACRDRLERVPAILSRFRQAVLSVACSGRLTEDWREGDGCTHDADGPDIGSSSKVDTSDLPQLPVGWRWEHLGGFIRSIEAGRSFTCDERPPDSNEVGVLKVSAVTWGRFNEDESKTCTDPAKINPQFFVKRGDFLFSRANTIELVGACVIADKVVRRTMLSDKTLRILFRNIEPQWVLWMLRSPHGRAEIERLATGNQQSMRNIGQARIRAIRLPVPPRDEQRELTRRIDALIKLSNSVDARTSKQKERVELLSQSLLSLAFRGELVPTEAELAAKEGRPFESAEELLGKIASGGSISSGRSSPRHQQPASRTRRVR